MEKVKWGVLGTAGICAQTLPGMALADNCIRYAIAGRDAAKAKAFQDRYGFERSYGSYEALLADKEVQAVYIPLPNHLHKEWAVKALEQGKHVLCEKPLALSEGEALEMYAAAEKNRVYLMEAFAYLHSPYMRALAEEIQRGSIGELRYMETSFVISTPPASNIRMNRETGGGALYDVGVYNISFIQFLMGREPESIQAAAGFFHGVDGVTTGVLSFGEKQWAGFTAGMALEEGRDCRIDRFYIHGSKGAIRNGRFTYNGEGKQSYVLTSFDAGEEVEKVIDTPQNYSLEIAQLGRCILEGEKPAVCREFSLGVARTVDRVLQKIGYEPQACNH